MIEILTPKSEAEWLGWRCRDVTSTESSCLLGENPYLTRYEMFFRKRDPSIASSFKDTERTRIGRLIQEAIATEIAEENKWEIHPIKDYMRDPDRRMGSSFDYGIGKDGLLEIKNVDSLVYRDNWIVDGDDIEAPVHIEVQVQHQLAVSGKRFAYLGALVGGNKIVLLRRERDETVIDRLREEIRKFWQEVDSGVEPTPDFMKDAAFIHRLHQFAEPGKVLDLRADSGFAELAAADKLLLEQSKEVDAKRAAIKAQMMMKAGTAEKVLGNGFSVTAGIVGPSHVEYDRAGYRNWRINWSKKKETK